MAQNWNGNEVPVAGDPWQLVTDLRRLADYNNRIIPVTSKAERDQLAASAPNGTIPEGTIVLRLDQFGTMDYFIDGAWVDGNSEYRHLVAGGDISIPSSSANYTTIAPLTGGAGDPGNIPDLTYSGGGVVTIARGGMYSLNGAVTFNAGPVSTRVAALNVSGALHRTWAANISYRHTLTVVKELRIAAGSTVRLQAFQDSGATIPLIPDADQTYLTIRRIGA